MPLFQVKETSHWAAFIYSSVIVALSASVTLEWRVADPLNSYHRKLPRSEKLTLGDVAQTSIVAGVTTFVLLVLLWYLFGLGKASLVNPTCYNADVAGAPNAPNTGGKTGEAPPST